MRVLFYVSRAYSISVVNPIIKAIDNSDGSISYRLYASSTVEKVMPTSWDKSLILDNVNEVKAYNPNFVLCPGNHLDYRMPGLKIQLFHGVGVEKDSHYVIRHFFDVYFTSGPYTTERFRELQKKHKYFQVIETGWSKFDHILNYDKGNLSRSSIPAKYDRVILYAPTFSRRLESASILSDTLLRDINENELLLIKFHELMPGHLKDNFLKSQRHNIKIIQDTDVTPWLHQADVMISDTSSVVYEFMALKKPVITYRTKNLQEKALDIQHPSELRPALDLLFEQPLWEFGRRNQVLLSVNPYLDGKVSERIIDSLQKLHQDNFQARRKPLNLYRKWQVLYKYYVNRKDFE